MDNFEIEMARFEERLDEYIKLKESKEYEEMENQLFNDILIWNRCCTRFSNGKLERIHPLSFIVI